jgi:rifampicin phosphotransferase
METNTEVFDLAQATTADRARVGGKAGVLGELAAAGFPVPPGLVVTAEALNIDGWEESLEAAAGSLGAPRLAVRSSAAAEDLPDASYAGLYETYLNVPVGGLGEMVRRCFAAATTQRVSTYHPRHGNGTAPGMAVLVQAMVEPMAAGVAFTAHPLSGDPNQALVTAVPGLGDRLVSGEAVGEEWTVTAQNARRSRPIPAGSKVLTGQQAQAVTDLARSIADRYGQPQDIEWAIDRDGRLWLLQARPMTAVPKTVSWTAPSPGLWSRNFRLGEWLPEAVTPLFAHLAAAGLGERVPRRHARNRRDSSAVPMRPRQRLVLQHPSSSLTQSAGPGVMAGPRPRSADPLQRADPGQPEPSGRRSRRTVPP